MMEMETEGRWVEGACAMNPPDRLDDGQYH